MYQFKFFSEDSKHLNKNCNTSPKSNVEVETFLPSPYHIALLKEAKNKYRSVRMRNFDINYIDIAGINDVLFKGNSSLVEADLQHSDLIAGVYEGGGKVWECTNDLLQYLESCYELSYFQGKSVLDLGCGCGLAGIYAAKCGAKVFFQDYNKDVINDITIINVLLNAPQKSASTFKFRSGSWDDAHSLFGDEKFDLILTAETIYSTRYYPSLIKIFKDTLRAHGTVLLAAKSYYFGVGGSLRAFEDNLDCNNIKYKSVWSTRHGLHGLEREILEIKNQY